MGKDLTKRNLRHPLTGTLLENCLDIGTILHKFASDKSLDERISLEDVPEKINQIARTESNENLLVEYAVVLYTEAILKQFKETSKVTVLQLRQFRELFYAAMRELLLWDDVLSTRTKDETLNTLQSYVMKEPKTLFGNPERQTLYKDLASTIPNILQEMKVSATEKTTGKLATFYEIIRTAKKSKKVDYPNSEIHRRAIQLIEATGIYLANYHQLRRMYAPPGK